ncbi:MAG: helix-turn-helix domain-containing protein [Candidatus Eremiobacteraeota bacterium]|nr:helix-turn-helix domain-containing protein [Candidatus Eremiobacteraeota bacterium]
MIRSVTAHLHESTLRRATELLRADGEMFAQCQRMLAPLEREDRERGHNLLQTLQTYYECGLRVDKTAERMFLHRNSVRYRLDRVRSLLRCDIDDPQTISACVLALSICRRPAPGKVGHEHAI